MKTSTSSGYPISTSSVDGASGASRPQDATGALRVSNSLLSLGLGVDRLTDANA